MRYIVSKYKIDIYCIASIVLLSFPARILFLGTVPPNISGDEITNLSDVYTIIFGNNIHPFSFMGDGSVAAMQFYWSAFFIHLFGLQKAIFGLRFSIAVLSLLSLIPFYFILKDMTSRFNSTIFTTLLGVNYVFLNFSRTAWINMGIVFTGLCMLLFLEKARKENRHDWYVIAGIFGGITFFGYHYGKILLISVAIFLLSNLLIRMNRSKHFIKGLVLFFCTVLLITLPLLINISIDKGEAVLRRPKSTFAFSREVTHNMPTLWYTATQQFNKTFLGLILLDGSVMSEGAENQRYVPLYTPPVNPIIKLLFLPGIIFALLFAYKKLALWWVVAISSLFTLFLTIHPPNFSRGLFYIPFIYIIAGLFFYNVFLSIQKRVQTKYIGPLMCVIIALVGVLFFLEAKYYFSWMKTKDLANARQPAIDYSEFPAWQEYQIKRVKNNLPPITNYEWYQIRSTILQSFQNH